MKNDIFSLYNQLSRCSYVAQEPKKKITKEMILDFLRMNQDFEFSILQMANAIQREESAVLFAINSLNKEGKVKIIRVGKRGKRIWKYVAGNA